GPAAGGCTAGPSYLSIGSGGPRSASGSQSQSSPGAIVAGSATTSLPENPGGRPQSTRRRRITARPPGSWAMSTGLKPSGGRKRKTTGSLPSTGSPENNSPGAPSLKKSGSPSERITKRPSANRTIASGPELPGQSRIADGATRTGRVKSRS